jgi:hypothetical protein
MVPTVPDPGTKAEAMEWLSIRPTSANFLAVCRCDLVSRLARQATILSRLDADDWSNNRPIVRSSALAAERHRPSKMMLFCGSSP